MPLRSKEYRSMEQKVCTIKVEIALGRNDGSTLCGNVGKVRNPQRNVGFFSSLLFIHSETTFQTDSVCQLFYFCFERSLISTLISRNRNEETEVER